MKFLRSQKILSRKNVNAVGGVCAVVCGLFERCIIYWSVECTFPRLIFGVASSNDVAWVDLAFLSPLGACFH